MGRYAAGRRARSRRSRSSRSATPRPTGTISLRRHRVRAPGRRDHRPRRRVLHGDRPRHRVRDVRLPGARARSRSKAATRYAANGSGSRSADGLPRECDPLRGRLVRVPGRRSAPVLDGLDLEIAGRRLARDRRAERRRQDDADQAARAAVRADGRPDHRRRRRRARARPRELAQPDRGDLPGLRALRAARGRQHRRSASVAHLGDEPAIRRAAQRAGRARA